MAESVVNFVVETIGNMVIEEAKFLYGVEDQVEQLQMELDRMLSFLRDAEARQDEQGNLKVWISQTRDLAYEAADLLERYAFKIALQKENFFKRSVCIFNECYDRHSIGSEIQSLQSKIAGLTTSFQGYGIHITEREDPRSSQQQLRRTYSRVAEDDFIKLDNDVEKLVGHLVNQNEADLHGVVSICGMGGLGKTTIARKVYNHPKVQGHFKELAWVCISQQRKMTEILQGILIKFFPMQRDEIAKWTEDELIGKLFETMQNTKCLVVLDDIWSTEAWESIKEAFPIAKNGSKLLLTTRNKGVALHIAPNGFHHEPRLLNDNESWELLQLKALRGRTYTGPEQMNKMEELGKAMVKHCGGLPLAVVVLGGILVKKRNINEWESIHKNVRAYIRRGENVVEEECKVKKILALSYKDLPQKMKPCFLSLGRFPEDSDIDVEKLCQLWLAEGMISIRDQIGEESMMDITERYLREFAERSMVQVKMYESFDRMKSCRLHDLMRDLTLEKAKEENFFLLVHSRNGFDDQVYESSSSTHQIHRLVIHIREEDVHKYVPPQKRTTRHLRLLQLLVEDTDKWRKTQTIMSQLSWLRMLRVLEIAIGDGELKLPKAVGNLIHLRYLSVRALVLSRLPSSIGNLKHLQTLDLEVVGFCRHIPDVFCKMRQLKYLLLPLYHYHSFSLKGLNKLEILKWFKGPISNFSNNEASRFASSLVSLSLEGSQLADDPMETLENLPNLRYLVLGIYSFVGTEMQCGPTRFPQLKSLVLCLLPNLVKWTIVEGSMPNLCSLKIARCTRLEMIPDGLKYISTLRNLKIIAMPKEFESRILVTDGQEGDDFFKIRHVILVKVRQEWTEEDDEVPYLPVIIGWVCWTKVVVPTGLVVEGSLAFSKEEEESG